jgi:hypothetical protein
MGEISYAWIRAESITYVIVVVGEHPIVFEVLVVKQLVPRPGAVE